MLWLQNLCVKLFRAGITPLLGRSNGFFLDDGTFVTVSLTRNTQDSNGSPANYVLHSQQAVAGFFPILFFLIFSFITLSIANYGGECRVNFGKIICGPKETHIAWSDITASDVSIVIFAIFLVLLFFYYFYLLVNSILEIENQNFFPEDWGIAPGARDKQMIPDIDEMS